MTRTELEARRIQAIPDLLKPYLSLADIAEPNGVSRTTVQRWRRAARAGDPLTIRRAPGRPPRMKNPEQLRRVFATRDHWTHAQFAAAVEKHFKVHYHPDHMGRIMHRLGLIEKKREYGRNRQQ